MLFNSIDFAIYLPIVFLLYWFVFNRNLRIQNLFLIASGYLFYGWWNWKFLFLIILSTAVDYFIGIKLSELKQKSSKKALLIMSICVNLGLLGFFKYYNFFLENFIEVFTLLGHKFNAAPLQVILPVGISFYTFQSLGYCIDVYRGKCQATRDFAAFAAFVSFFPQLVAGPIERAQKFLPSFHSIRRFDYSKATHGMRQILWGLFKKVVIADNCAEIVNQVFNSSDKLDSSSLLLGAFLFSIQIYCDFSGYSDIALGTARLFGFELMQNFSFPYFSRSISEFWHRWHISLSTWFKDYVYIPLGGSRVNVFKKLRNIFITFVISGFWHGANWTFIAWGALNALYICPEILSKSNHKETNIIAEGKLLPNFKDLFKMIFTFSLTIFAWIFFRSQSISQAIQYIQSMLNMNNYGLSHIKVPSILLCSITLFFAIEWLGRERQFAIEGLALQKNNIMRWSSYILIALAIIFFGGKEQEFIYFQF